MKIKLHLLEENNNRVLGDDVYSEELKYEFRALNPSTIKNEIGKIIDGFYNIIQEDNK